MEDNPYAPPSGDRARPPVPPHPMPPTPPHPYPGGPVPGPVEPEPTTPKPAPDPESVRRASRQVLHFGLLTLAAMFVSTLALPWQAASLLFAVAAIGVGLRALRTVWKVGLRGAVVPMLVVGLAFTSLLAVTMAATLTFWPVQVERQECLSGALTISAKQACEHQYEERLQERRIDLQRRD